MSVTTLRSTSQEEINKKHLVMGNKDPTIASLQCSDYTTIVIYRVIVVNNRAAGRRGPQKYVNFFKRSYSNLPWNS